MDAESSSGRRARRRGEFLGIPARGGSGGPRTFHAGRAREITQTRHIDASPSWPTPTSPDRWTRMPDNGSPRAPMPTQALTSTSSRPSPSTPGVPSTSPALANSFAALDEAPERVLYLAKGPRGVVRPEKGRARQLSQLLSVRLHSNRWQPAEGDASRRRGEDIAGFFALMCRSQRLVPVEAQVRTSGKAPHPPFTAGAAPEIDPAT
jgi:hypothetical protein